MKFRVQIKTKPKH